MEDKRRVCFVQSAVVLRLYGLITCILAVKLMPVASPMCAHTPKPKRQWNEDLCTNSQKCLAAPDKIPCTCQMQTPGLSRVYIARGAQGVVAWQDTEKKTTLNSSSVHQSVYI